MVQRNCHAGNTGMQRFVGEWLLRIEIDARWLVGIDADVRVEGTGKGWRVRTMACVATTSSW